MKRSTETYKVFVDQCCFEEITVTAEFEENGGEIEVFQVLQIESEGANLDFTKLSEDTNFDNLLTVLYGIDQAQLDVWLIDCFKDNNPYRPEYDKWPGRIEKQLSRVGMSVNDFLSPAEMKGRI